MSGLSTDKAQRRRFYVCGHLIKVAVVLWIRHGTSGSENDATECVRVSMSVYVRVRPNGDAMSTYLSGKWTVRYPIIYNNSILDNVLSF